MAALIGVTVQPKSGGGSTATVPIDLLSQDGVPPEQGDKVSFSCDATVKSVSGTNATVSIDAINGEPVAEEAGEGPGDNESGESDTGTNPGANPGPGLGASPLKAARVPRVPSPGTAALGAALRKHAKGQPMPF